MPHKRSGERIRADRRVTARKTPLRKEIVPKTGARSRNEVTRDRASNAASAAVNDLILNTRFSKNLPQGFASDKREALKAINKTLDANRRVKKTIKKRIR